MWTARAKIGATSSRGSAAARRACSPTRCCSPKATTSRALIASSVCGRRKVRALYSQIVGRGTRLYPGKDHLLLLDFLWMSEEHNLVKPANLIASDPEEANAITAALGFEGDLEEAKGKADADRAATLRQRLKQNARRASRTFDAVEFALSLGEVETRGLRADDGLARRSRRPASRRTSSASSASIPAPSLAKARRARCSTSSSFAAISASPARARCSGCASSGIRRRSWRRSRKRSSSSMRSGTSRRSRHEALSLSRSAPAAPAADARLPRPRRGRRPAQRRAVRRRVPVPRRGHRARRKPRRSSSRGPRSTA